MRRLFAALLFVSVTSSCDTFNPVTENTMTGTWRGTSAGETFEIVMQQSGNTVAGTGKLTSTALGTRNLSIAGTFYQPVFIATISPNGGTAVAIEGTVEGRAFVGTLTGGGFNGDGLALMRD